MRILLVDDDEDDYLITRDLLQEQSATAYRLDWEPDYDRALAKVVAQEHDVYLVDYMLGRRNALELISEAVARGGRIPMIVLTGRGDEQVDKACLDAGADDFLVKNGLDGTLLSRSIRYALARHRDREALRDSETRFRQVLETADQPMLLLGEDRQVLFANPAAQRFFEALGSSSLPETLRQLDGAGDDSTDIELPGRHGEGGAWLEVRTSDTSWKGKPARLVSLRDVTQRHETERALALRDRAIESSSNGIVICDMAQRDHPIIYVNPAFERMTGYSKREVLGRNCRFLQGEETDQPAIQDIREAVEQRREGHAVLRNYRRDGSVFWNELHVSPVRDETGGVTHFVGVQTDVSERKRFQAELAFQAGHDSLTRLPNRDMLLDRIEQAIAMAHRQRGMLAVLFIDLDKFKVFNDSEGHLVGDHMLQTVADRLRGALRETDTIARYGGDEFVMLCPGLRREEDALQIANTVVAAIAEPMDVDGRSMVITCSIGISLYPKDGENVVELLKHADLAMYRAKEGGRNNCEFFTIGLNAKAARRLMLSNDLRQALVRDELKLVYQPQVAVPEGRVVGVEALLRWEHPELGVVSPASFIPIAEETGQIVEIGLWVLRTATRQMKSWLDAGVPPMRLAVNISARQFMAPGFADELQQVLEETALPPHLLELELTETLIMDHAEHVLYALARVRALGATLSIDDFGTGYSSLSYLKRLPIDRLKIDRSFVADITADDDSAAIVRATIALARTLRLHVIAEGVESEQELEVLHQMGCEEAQGYLFSRPQPPKRIPDIIEGMNTTRGPEQ
ncbi:MAG: EAL domain-containing protein [Ectothiorhodospiraceae bacterium]|nr:EAL domain-containing protein [Ectothiorhodospiraceae bacterium]MCH8503144.1 EAL domain-containing protein [Ectothiorhodospiraceae bacterium]